MTDLFATGRVIDFILALMALEGVLLSAYWHRVGRGIAPGDLLANLLAGAGLLLAARGAVLGAGWPWIMLCLVIALLAHAADLRRRWPRQSVASASLGGAEPQSGSAHAAASVRRSGKN